MSKNSISGELLAGIAIALFIILIIIENSELAGAFHSTLKIITWIGWGGILIIGIVKISRKNKK